MNTIKSKFLLITAALGLALACVPAAQADSLRFAGRGTTNAFTGAAASVATNVAFHIVSSAPDKAGAPAVEYLNVTSDTAGGAVRFLTESNRLTLSAASSGATNKLYVASGGAAFGAGATIVLRHAGTDTYERSIVMASSATVITLTNATVSAVAIGDTVHLMTLGALLPVGAVHASTPPSKEFAPPHPLFTGVAGEPLLVEVTAIGTNTFGINAISGRYHYAVINGAVVK